MSQRQKLLEKAKRNPSGLSFDKFQTLLSQSGWTKKHQRGSHIYWYSPQGYRLSIQSESGMAKEYQVEQFLKEEGH